MKLGNVVLLTLLFGSIGVAGVKWYAYSNLNHLDYAAILVAALAVGIIWRDESTLLEG